MNVLGLSFDYHDSAAALVRDGEIVAAAEEERFTRIKHDSSFPHRAAAFCLETAGIAAAQLDAVAFYERPFVKFDRIVSAALDGLPDSVAFLNRTVNSWIRDGKFDAAKRICDSLGMPQDKIYFADHHQSHAASAFFSSPFEEATIITLDGVGEHETFSVSEGRGLRINKLLSVSFPHSIGLFYSAFTAFLGFEVNDGEYKVMGMAAFGEPVYADKIRPFFQLAEDGSFSLRQDCFTFLHPHLHPFNEALVEIFGLPRAPESAFDIGDRSQSAVSGSVEAQSRHYANIAASVQLVTEEVILHLARAATRRTGLKDLVMAGGVALNSLANGKLQQAIDGSLFIQPAAGDAGGALGAALYYTHCVAGRPRGPALTNIYLGRAAPRDEIIAALRDAALESWTEYDDEEELLDAVASLLASGAVIGLFHGRFEWGPRALGARSILADPTRADMQRIVNEKIKFREPFRPFAPAVLAEHAHEFFDIPPMTSTNAPENFMLSVAPVRPDKRAVIPAVTHVDGTARVQLVRSTVAPRFARLIACFAARRGVPILLNTSFNLRGEPIVASPTDALRTFSWSGMDYLVLGDVLVRKEKLECA